MRLISSTLKDFQGTPLPGREAHEEMTIGLSRELNRDYFTAMEKARKSAVAIVLEETLQGVNTLFIKRASKSKHHAGQIGFPGGKAEEFDASLLDTALRELHEELDIRINTHQVLNQFELSPVYIPVTNFTIYPFVIYTQQTIIPNPNYEVEEVLRFDLERLLDTPITRGKIKIESGITLPNVPQFDIDNQIIWGATSLIVNELRLIF